MTDLTVGRAVLPDIRIAYPGPHRGSTASPYLHDPVVCGDCGGAKLPIGVPFSYSGPVCFCRGPVITTPNPRGWICPRCDGVNAPTERTCVPCGSKGI